LALGIIWGISGIVLIQNDVIIQNAIALIWMCGLSAEAIVTLSIDKGNFLAFSLSALIPFSLYLLIHEGPTNTLGASAIFIFLGFIVLSAIQMHNMLIQWIHLQLENAQLGMYLGLEKVRIEKTNEELEERIK